MSNVYAQINSDGLCLSVTRYETVPETLDTSTNILLDSINQDVKAKVWNGSAWEDMPISAEQKEAEGRMWRDHELLRTDSLLLLDDYPQKDGLAAYRQALRDWPSTDDFPDTRPTLGG